MPTIIVVFGSDQSFTPYKPLFRGKPAQLGGYFQGGEDINYITLNRFPTPNDYTTNHEPLSTKIADIPVPARIPAR